MKKLLFLSLILAGVLAGCFPEGEGKAELIEANPVAGPAGGANQDLTHPTAPGAATGGSFTNSAFPSTVTPGTAAPSDQTATPPTPATTG